MCVYISVLLDIQYLNVYKDKVSGLNKNISAIQRPEQISCKTKKDVDYKMYLFSVQFNKMPKNSNFALDVDNLLPVKFYPISFGSSREV